MSTWYEEGLRFECQSCGSCCVDHGSYAWVFLHEGDDAKLAGVLGMDLESFHRHYTRVEEGFVTLVNVEDRCVFLEAGKCRVYRARPIQCSTWPFWPENLKRRIWRSEIQPSCPGVGRGKRYTVEEIDRIAFRARQAVPLLRDA